MSTEPLKKSTLGAPPPSCKFNGVEFTPIPGVQYEHDYCKIALFIMQGEDELSWCRQLILNDLFFIVYFVLKIPIANHPFVVEACREVQHGPRDSTLDLWAREHFKSTILTTALTIQELLNDPEHRIGIFSYTKTAAKSFLKSIRLTLEDSELLKNCFPDILYDDPMRESPKWTEETITVKRGGYYKEGSIEAYGLTDGLPTGPHFTIRIYDDVETLDLVNTPELIQKTKEGFSMSHNLGTFTGVHRIVGTHYHHAAILNDLRNAKDEDGEPLYHVRIKPATDDGTPTGKPVLLPERRFKQLKLDLKVFYCQQLLDPTPRGHQTLDPDYINIVTRDELPSKLYRFMVIDPAGEREATNRTGDSWAMMVVGVEPYMDDLGISSIYILDLIAEPMPHQIAMGEIVDMYKRGGRILKLGVEKVAMTTTEVHVANALRAAKKYVSLDRGNLEILRPAGRKKNTRIEGNLIWPLVNGKISILDTVKTAYVDKLREEMSTFPVGRHDDILDALSYVYDMVKDYNFRTLSSLSSKEEPSKLDRWQRAFKRAKEKRGMGWMAH